ncbi:Detected protein of unknown function [Hibiscus syriacus]|uniref:Uncharacterized protein n=1 Tax=Hibiscus syriacus TaxID=106335 RepID=A0A6A3BY41_HIBSY|nr:uncharacterized protein LOC120207920 [Hibiscus syriacus]KAE8721545.1 Detected protein of unknown function [Hibiscus syriacus]
MADQCTSLTLSYFHQHQGMEELKQTLLFTTVELETTLMSAKEEIARREFELVHLKDVLIRTLKQRDEAQAQCRKLTMEKFLLHQQLQHRLPETASPFGVSREEDESKPAAEAVLSAGEPTMASTPGSDSISAPVTVPSPLPEHALKLAASRPLPAKGKLLQAVKDAGPLLQNLLWPDRFRNGSILRHSSPPLTSRRWPSLPTSLIRRVQKTTETMILPLKPSTRRSLMPTSSINFRTWMDPVRGTRIKT